MFSMTLDSRLNVFVNNTNSFLNRGNNPVMLNVSKEGEKYYKNLFSRFYWNPDIKSLRNLCLDETFLYNNDASYSCKFFNQDTYSIGEKYDWGYYLDYGLFSTYYKDEIFGNRGYLSLRYDCDGFVFISDSLADKLVEDKGLNSYEELLTSEEHCVLNIGYNNNKMAHRVCINNIVYTKYRTGPRAYELYNDFCLIYLKSNTGTYLKWAVEMDFNNDIFGTAKALKEINYFGYTCSNSIFDFKRMDLSTKEYFSDTFINDLFNNLNFDNAYDPIFYTIGIVSSLGIIGVFLLQKNKNELILSLLSIAVCVLVLMMVELFVFLPPLANVPLVCLIALEIGFFIQLFTKRKIVKGFFNYYELEI